jgi:hypothetical protein
LHWSFDPEDPNYRDDPIRAQTDIETWVASVNFAHEAALENEAAEAEAKKSPTQIEFSDIKAVLKSIGKQDREPPVGEGQLSLGLTSDLEALVAWGSQMKAKTRSVNKENLQDLTSVDLGRVGAARLRQVLLGRKRGPTTWDHVTMPDRAYSRIFTSPRILKNRTEARTREAGKLRSYDERTAAAERSSVHVYDRVAANIDGLSAGAANEITWLTEVKRLVGNFRFSLADGATVRALQAATWELSFKNMLETVSFQQRPKLSGEEFDRLERAMAARLFHGPQHVKTRYWNQMVDLAIEYVRAVDAELKHNKMIGRRIMRPA